MTLQPALDSGPIPASACSHALPAVVAAMCLSCDHLCAIGYWIADGRLFLCDDCGGDVAAAYAAAHRLEVHEPLADGEVSVRLLFAPGDDPATSDVQISPEPDGAAQELAHLGMAIRRLGTYLSAYSAAMHAEDGAPA